jgi:hypothetical protein
MRKCGAPKGNTNGKGNKGHVLSLATRRKMSLARKGKHYSKLKEKMCLVALDVQNRPEVREEMRRKMVGNTYGHCNKDKPKPAGFGERLSLVLKGRPSGQKGISKPEGFGKRVSLALREYYFNPFAIMFPEDYGFYLSTEWIRIRKRILERDNYTCRDCEKQNCKLDVHHKIPRKVSHDDSDENLLSLCDSCHKKAEMLYYRNYKEEPRCQL